MHWHCTRFGIQNPLYEYIPESLKDITTCSKLNEALRAQNILCLGIFLHQGKVHSHQASNLVVVMYICIPCWTM